MKTRLLLHMAAAGLLSALNLQVSAASEFAFTYQGRLNDGANPANGIYDVRFTINDAATGPAQIGSAITNAATLVSNGLFAVTLDFGPGVFTGGARWLEIGVRPGGSPVGFTTLAPRQQLAPTPYALYTPNAGAASTAGSANTVAVNAVANAGLQANAVTSDKVADGTITAGDLSPALASNTFWRLGGNSGTAAGVNYLGTTDNQPLEFRVNNQRGLLLSGQPDLPPNLIGGVTENRIDIGLGSVIAGGGRSDMPNKISSSWGAIGGGLENGISSNAHCATIAGGHYNSIEPCPGQAGAFSYGSIGGGVGNGLETNATFSTIGGGWLNRIQKDASSATIAGGRENRISPGSFHTTIGGGIGNQIQNNATVATIGGGYYNTIRSNGSFGTIPGGRENSAANYAFAAGYRAKADHTGTFVWADSTDADFASTGNNQFLIRASGNVGINKTNPSTALDVNGTVTAPIFAGAFSGNGAGLTNLVNAPTYSAGNGLALNGNAFSLRPSSSLTNDNAQPYALRLVSPSGYWGGPVGVWGVGGDPAQMWPALPCGVFGESWNGLGIWGVTRSAGTWSAGARGQGIGSATGLLGYSDSGYAVKAVTSFSGTAVYGENTNSSGLAGRFLGNVAISGSLRLSDTALYLRGGSDTFHGLSWYTSGSFAGANPDGPVLYGCAGGALGTMCGGQRIALAWNSSGNVGIGTANPSTTLDVNGEVSAPLVTATSQLRLAGARTVISGFDGNGSHWFGPSPDSDLAFELRRLAANDYAFTLKGDFYGRSFNPTSDRSQKENFKPVDPQAVLEKVAGLPISEWNFKSDSSVPHIGPMAQDFHAAFGLGTDDKHIATVDADGVALAAIQGLNQKLEEKNAALERKVAELEAVVNQLAAKVNRANR